MNVSTSQTADLSFLDDVTALVSDGAVTPPVALSAPAFALAAARRASKVAPVAAPAPFAEAGPLQGLEVNVLEFVAELRSPEAVRPAEGVAGPVLVVGPELAPPAPVAPVGGAADPVAAVESQPEVVVSEAPAVAVADPAGPRLRGASVDGRPVGTNYPAPVSVLPWPAATNMETFLPEVDAFDYTDLSVLNKELCTAFRRLFEVSQALKAEQRSLAQAELVYRQFMRRALVKVSGGSAEIRKALAELSCEEYENAVWLRTQTVEEMKKRSMDCRDHLKGLENLSHNVRAQIAVST